jgi:hypothetical protein
MTAPADALLPRRRLPSFLAALLVFAALSQPASGAIDTNFLEQPWPKQRVHEFEVGRHPVRWRQLAGRERGIFAGAQFTTASPLQTTWDLATEYRDVGAMTPGVTAVTTSTHDDRHQTVDVTVKVLWRVLHLRFEVEQDPPRAVRFHVVNDLVGDYRGALLLAPSEDGQGTRGEVLTWFQPARPLPQGLVLTVQRMVLLQGVREFMAACDDAAAPAAPAEIRSQSRNPR